MKARAVGALTITAAFLFAYNDASRAETSTPAHSLVGTQAPDFSRPDLDGKTISLAALRGKVVLLNFWATWCTPCLTEVPRFAQWQQTYGGQGFQAIGISMDDEETPVRMAYKKLKFDYPVAMGNAQLAESYGGVYGLPVTYLIDARGTVRFRHHTGTDLDAIERELQHLLLERQLK